MFTEILLIISAIFLLYLSHKYAVGRPNQFPPGPPRIPIFGSYLFMMLSNFKYTHKAVLNFSKRYKSDIVGFHIGSNPSVAVHSPAGVREVLKNPDFDGRPQVFITKMRDPRTEVSGLFFMDGKVWHQQRRFMLRYLRDFGFGRRFEELELIMKEELTDLLDLIRNGPRFEHEKQCVKPGGYRILLPLLLNPASANSLFHIMHKERHARSEQAELFELIQKGMTFQRTGDDYGKMISIIPWVRHIFPNWSSYNKLMECNTFIYNYFAKLVDRHIETYEDGYERNFLDLYIKEMKTADQLGAANASTPFTSFNRDQFVMALSDFAFPAFTTTGVQIAILIQYLLLYPNVCQRMQKEIDEVVGTGRLPCLNDRKHLPYTEATIREALRIATVVPSDIPHKALVDTKLLGYKIPKDTTVVPSLYAYHLDQKLWGDPHNFRPERFLTDNGELCLQKDVSFAFGAGNRICPGETFARNMIFLLTTTLIQNFNLVLAPGDKLPRPAHNLSGFIISPPDFWLSLEERHSNKHNN